MTDNSSVVAKRRARQARWRENNREHYLEQRRLHDAKYREANREKRREWDKRYQQENPEVKRESRRNSDENHRAARRASNVIYQRIARHTRRKSILEALGARCVQCGFADARALQIDHVTGGGSQHRKSFPSLTSYYDYVQANIASGQFQILCANCNQIKRIENKEHRLV